MGANRNRIRRSPQVNKLIVAAPFGNYLHFANTTRILGTYTLHRRGGWPLRIWRILSTVRYRDGTWVNCLGLTNPGITSAAGPIQISTEFVFAVKSANTVVE